ncbi:hypothetical protein NDU88_011194 [Pleurodeles waltl]|uniref:Uncharacterized protein n=1 Tax=Pleurodeles waltl TaxID=8319 RepID=A0AAV7S129_PLEWA|nr:hypothetical protein NDU88_011194 [Pleurodeles waltl]
MDARTKRRRKHLTRARRQTEWLSHIVQKRNGGKAEDSARTRGPGATALGSRPPSFPNKPNLCIVRCVKEYEACTRDLQQTPSGQLLIALQTPFEPVFAATVARKDHEKHGNAQTYVPLLTKPLGLNAQWTQYASELTCVPGQRGLCLTFRDDLVPSIMLRRLMTPRPIRSEDGRDVRGRRGGKAEARTKRGVAAGRLLVGLISCGKNKRY